MTIIAAKDGVMVADGICIIGQIMQPVGFPKIVRLLDGRLIGCAGYAADCYAAQKWFFDDEPAKRPDWIGTDKDSEVDVLMMKLDGSIWRASKGVDGFYPMHDGVAIGSGSGCIVAETAMHLGFDAESAVRTAIRMTAALGGVVQVERIHAAPTL